MALIRHALSIMAHSPSWLGVSRPPTPGRWGAPWRLYNRQCVGGRDTPSHDGEREHDGEPAVTILGENPSPTTSYPDAITTYEPGGMPERHNIT